MFTTYIRTEQSSATTWDVLLTTAPGVVRTIAIRTDPIEADRAARQWATDLGVEHHRVAAVQLAS